MTRYLSCVLVAGCAFGPTESPAAPRPFTPPSLVTLVENGINVDVRINDLPLTRYELAQFLPIRDLVQIPPYYFKNGTNTISIKYVGNLATYPDAKLEIGVAQGSTTLATLAPTKFSDCDGSDFDKRCEMTATFVLHDVPEWQWVKSGPILDTEANHEALREAYTDLHARLRKLRKTGGGDFRSRMRATMGDIAISAKLQTQPLAELEEMITLAAHPRAALDDLPWDDTDVKFELVGNGTHARMWRYRIPVIDFQGGAHDAPSGQMGPFTVAFDVWFRLVDGKFVPVALWRTNPMVALPKR